MDKFIVLSILLVCSCYEANSMNPPGPPVYVVTPSPRTAHAQGRAAPFYYHNWMRRMDSPNNITTTTSTQKPQDTPDLIFAEFESGNRMKSIRKLLEKEKIETKTTTTTTRRPIYMTDDANYGSQDDDFGIPIQTYKKEDKKPVDMTDHFASYNNRYNPNDEDPTPVYRPPSIASTTTSTSTAAPIDVQNIWHIIDSQKFEQNAGKWEEEPVPGEHFKDSSETKSENEENNKSAIDDNFALPGFATNPGNGGENESRAIHSEHNMRFPYVNLKPFQVKNLKKPLLNTISSNKQGTNMLSLDNFHDLKNPVRGEAQDVVPVRKPIDRYNPAQPYLPDYATKSKQSSPKAPPKAVANLVPPPPPPPPKITDDDFPAPEIYESFPPFGPVKPPAPLPPLPPPARPVPTPSILYQLPDSSEETSDDSGPPDSSNESDSPPIELEYHYKPPPPPVQTYSVPPPPAPKPYGGYSHDKPDVIADSPSDTEEKVEYGGYHYDKPEPPPPPPPKYLPPPSYEPGYDYTPSYGHHYHPYGYHYTTTTTTTTEMPRVNRYSYYYLGKKLYYLPLYFSVYFIIYVGALIIKAVLRHKIVYPNSWRPNDQTAGFFSKRSVDSLDLSDENLHEITGKVTHAIAAAGEKYFAQRNKTSK